MAFLVAAAIIWLGIHIGVSGTAVRGRLVRALGDMGFRAAFSLGSLLAIFVLVRAYRHAPTVFLWSLPAWAYVVLAGLMLVAFVLFVGSMAGPNPTSAGQEKALGRPATGMIRVTRQPMNCAFALWALVHMVANGEASALVFFGTFALTALAGMPSIDRKLAARDPAGWAQLAASTSIVPFGAILGGRNRFVALEIAWWVPVGGTLLWVAMLHLHPRIIGVPASPY